MALTGFPFPYDINNLLGGAVRIVYAVADGATPQAVPAGMDDVFSMVSPYALKTGWTDLGATKESFSYTRGFDTEGYEIQQLAGNVIEEITDITRTIEVSYADLRVEHLSLIEGGTAAVAPVAGGANKGAQQRASFGSFSSLDRYRFAFISRRPKQAGTVTEPSGATRGRFFMGVAYQAQIAADDVEFEQAKGELSALGVTFTTFPESGQASGEEYGAYYDETAGTIAAV